MKPGTQISHYRILDELGRGGMGVVYRAEDTKLGRTVALKLLSQSMLGSESDRKRFYREARAAASLQHPNIATVYEIDEDEERIFIALEFVDGKPLDHVIEEGPLPLERAIEIGIQMAEGLDAAHERNIVHRDIKSGNVMLTGKDSAKITDFGLAKTAASTKLTQLGSTLGTVAYMSPEQARGEEVDHRSDLWSLGAVLYEMIAGKLPFPGDYEQAVIYGILNDDPKPLTSVRTGVPVELERIVEKCLRKDREVRYQHADEIAADLRVVDLKSPSRVAISDAGTNALEPDRPASATRRSPILWAAPLALIALIAGYYLGRLSGEGGRGHPMAVNSIRRVTSEAGLELNPAISPDGSMVAYVSGVAGDTELFVKHVEGGNRVSVAPSARGEVAEPAWSPDGSRIAFRKEGSIYIVPALGGVPEPLVLGSPDGSVYYRSPTWSPDGDRIAVAMFDSLLLIEVDSRNRQPVGRTDGSAYALEWSPDGSRLAGSTGNSWWNNIHSSFANVANSSVWTLDLETGRLEEIPKVSNQDESPDFGRAGSDLYLLSRKGGVMDVFRIELNGDDGATIGEPERLTVGLAAHTMAIDASGSRFAFSKVNLRRNIWRVRINPDGTVSTREAEPVTSGANVVEALDVSPDGTRLIYDSNVRGSQDIYLRTIGEPYSIQLTSDDANDFVSTWADETRVLFYSLRKGERDIYMLDTETRQVELLIDHEMQVQHPHLSRDGQIMAYRAYGADSAGIAFSKKMEDGSWGPLEIIRASPGIPRWSPTEDVLTYFNPTHDPGGLYIFDPETGVSRAVASGERFAVVHARWSNDGSTVVFQANERGRGWGIWSVRAGGGEPRQVVRFDEPDRIYGYHYIAVHGGYVYFTLKQAESDIWVMDVEAE